MPDCPQSAYPNPHTTHTNTTRPQGGGLCAAHVWHTHTHTLFFPCHTVQLRASEGEGGEVRYVQEDPRLPYRGAKIMSSQPQFLRDFSTGLNTTMFRWASAPPKTKEESCFFLFLGV